MSLAFIQQIHLPNSIIQTKKIKLQISIYNYVRQSAYGPFQQRSAQDKKFIFFFFNRNNPFFFSSVNWESLLCDICELKIEAPRGKRVFFFSAHAHLKTSISNHMCMLRTENSYSNQVVSISPYVTIK